ncbi:Ribonuclease H-like superfamily [Sesbania bispinosa]|nr:Ribonuclease H-like superfamily [Sesbania bispinosa]
MQDYVNIRVQDESRPSLTSSTRASQNWRPPPTHAVKFNCDASFNRETKSGVAAVVARDHEGHLVAVSSERFCAPSPVVVEALAIRAATVLASNCGWPSSLIESDSLQVIEGVRSNTQNWAIQHIINDIKHLSSYLPRCGFLWANREANKVAHELAASHSDPSSPPVSLASIPIAVRALVEEDRKLAQPSSRWHPP